MFVPGMSLLLPGAGQADASVTVDSCAVVYWMFGGSTRCRAIGACRKISTDNHTDISRPDKRLQKYSQLETVDSAGE